MERGSHAETEREAPDDGESDGLDFEHVRDVAGFVLRSVRRRRLLATLTFAVVAAVGITIAMTMPQTYSAQVKLLAQRSSAIRMLSSQNQQMDSVDNPTKNVATMITRRENIVALVKEANLAERFYAARPPPLKLKDRIMAALFGPLSDEDKTKAMVFTLDKSLDVVTDDATVTITVEWQDPRVSYELVTLVQKNFLEARYDSDVAVINDSITVLEEHAKSALDHVDGELSDYQKVVADRVLKSAVPPSTVGRLIMTGAPHAAVSSAPSPQAPDPELTKALEEKRMQIRALEEARQRTLETLRQQLVQAQLTLTPMHPTVIALQQKVETMSQPSPELTQLRGEERVLMAQIAPPKASPSPSASATSTPPNVPAGVRMGLAVPSAPPPLPRPGQDRDGQLQLADSELASAIHAYEDAMARIDAAKVELDITRTAYKHKYTVVTPAELPKKPKKATAQMVGIGSVLGASLLAILLAAALDLVAGLILEPWQVRRRLKLDVLGEFDRPS
ncbi:MAG: hypothetical protein ACLP1X_28580 [Polyangiaceae bacterium]|jgi:uncharacterized protein involved in exopolysaccharide biosynthesis